MAGPLTDRPFGSFSELSEATVAYLNGAGFEYATPVQAAVLPIFSGNKDVVVDSCTGSGKTLAFLLPVLEKLRAMPKTFSKFDVLSIHISAESGDHVPCGTAPVRNADGATFETLGGRQVNPNPGILPDTGQKVMHDCVYFSEVETDLNEISSEGGNIIIGTPGRINDIMKKKTSLNFRTLEVPVNRCHHQNKTEVCVGEQVLVLDEADRLLDLGFEAQLLEIVHALPKQRRTGLFSATQAVNTGKSEVQLKAQCLQEACETLVKAGLRNPLRVNVTTTAIGSSQKITNFAQRTPQSLSVSAAIVPLDQKLNHLIQFVKDHSDKKIIVYGLTCACIEYWFYILRKVKALQQMTIRALHGKMQQSGREKAISAFTQDTAGVLLATDVAARGLDIPAVHWVIQLDAPQDPNVFVHRVGRAARMGRAGDALIYLTANEESYVKFLQLRKVPITVRQSSVNNVEDYTEWLRHVSETEREAMLKGIAAYTSYVRAYGNHHCPYIFNLKELDLGKLAYLFGLLYLPGMKEIKTKEVVTFVPSRVDPHSVPFLDKSREAERQKRWLQLQKEARDQSKKTCIRKNKRKKKKDSIATEPEKKLKRTRNPTKRDLEELEEDYKLYRLEKKGKLRHVEEDALFNDEDSDDDITTSNVPLGNTEQEAEPEKQAPDRVQPAIPDRPQHEHMEMIEHRDALRKSLHQKLNAMKNLRRTRKNTGTQSRLAH